MLLPILLLLLLLKAMVVVGHVRSVGVLLLMLRGAMVGMSSGELAEMRRQMMVTASTLAGQLASQHFWLQAEKGK